MHRFEHTNIDSLVEAILAPHLIVPRAPQRDAALDTDTGRNLARAGRFEIGHVPKSAQGVRFRPAALLVIGLHGVIPGPSTPSETWSAFLPKTDLGC